MICSFVCRYTLAGDIAILRVYFDESDTNAACLNPIRFILDEYTASACMYSVFTAEEPGFDL